MKVYCIGESVLDIIIKGFQPISVVPGGSALNSAVSLGRMGIPVTFISEVSNDQSGKFIRDFLVENNINIDYFHLQDQGQTKVALAFLNDRNSADYQFYHVPISNRLNFPFPKIEKNDIILFSSYFAIDEDINEKLVEFLSYAKSKGAFLYYDINFRKPHLKELESSLPKIKKNMELSHVIKGSDDDYHLVFQYAFEDWVNFSLKYPDKIHIRSAAENPVCFSYQGKTLSFPVNPIVPESSVGAGDNFNAGFVYGYYQFFQKNNENPIFDDFEKIIKTANGFARECCLSRENYITKEQVANVIHI